ncbi:hypothetical protein VTL71DRAFT_1418 [Oculimacula yallundae]|uniref:Uncharacterized protein n=1 Tax=Oculimacula yallundae TaxID=86028 RepID=A0ABR4CCR6_9HELO
MKLPTSFYLLTCLLRAVLSQSNSNSQVPSASSFASPSSLIPSTLQTSTIGTLISPSASSYPSLSATSSSVTTTTFETYSPTYSPSCTSSTITSTVQGPSATDASATNNAAPSATSPSTSELDIEYLFCQGDCLSPATAELVLCIVWELDFGTQDWKSCFNGIPTLNSNILPKRTTPNVVKPTQPEARVPTIRFEDIKQDCPIKTWIINFFGRFKISLRSGGPNGPPGETYLVIEPKR